MRFGDNLIENTTDFIPPHGQGKKKAPAAKSHLGFGESECPEKITTIRCWRRVASVNSPNGVKRRGF
jgi:hypothetical protein